RRTGLDAEVLGSVALCAGARSRGWGVGRCLWAAAAAGAVFIPAPLWLNAEPRHLINEAFLRRMKPTACLINTSRGPVVDEQALVRALQEKWIAGAGMDVRESEPPATDSPLARTDNVILQPDAVDSASP